jgi:long-chain acyl-CoA synthetase
MKHPAILVTDLLENSAKNLPDKTALVCDAFIESGVQRGDRVVLHLPNSIELVIAIFGVLKAGGVFVVVNPTMKEQKLAYILEDAGARICMTWPVKASSLGALIRALPDLSVGVVTGNPGDYEHGGHLLSYLELIHQHSPKKPTSATIDVDLACLIYTSGSTGEPKGVMSDHSNVVFAVQSITTYLENTSDDIILCVLPLSFDYGLYQLLMAFGMGARLVLEKGFLYPAQALQRIEEEQVTGFPGVPTVFSVLLTQDLSQYDLSSLSYITNTAAALPPAHIRRIREAFPQVRLYSMYGLTETKRTLYLPPDQLDIRPGSVGIPIPGTEVWLVDDEDRRVGPEQIGELVVRGRHVMRGYWGDERATARVFRPGPVPGERICYTGDLFRMDEDQYLYFVARKDEIIKSRGEKVSPKEIENVLYQLDGVLEATVVGVPDPLLGQAIKVFVVIGEGDIDERKINRHCRAHLEDFMMPKYVEICEALPKTDSLKIRRKDLR